MVAGQRVVLIRHGETEWSAAGRHTGWRDIPLSEKGIEQAKRLRPVLQSWHFAAVFCSPLQRAQVTCAEAGFGDQAETVDDCREWNYGDYEGLTLAEIRTTRPDWLIWNDGAPGGETLDQVAERARRVIERCTGVVGDVAIFAHGHFLRVLASCWIDHTPKLGGALALSTASLSIIGRERDVPAILRWNDTHHLDGVG